MKIRIQYIFLAMLPCLAATSCSVDGSLSRSTVDHSSSYVMEGSIERTTVNPADRKNYHVSSNLRQTTISVSDPQSQHQSEYYSGSAASTVAYNIDGMDYTGEAFSDDEMLTIFARLVAFARAGHAVCIADNGNTAGREVVDTFVSANEEEVVNWVAKMVRKGFSVTVDWDSEARLFRCTAYRKTK